ncbi:uncharacterized protein BDZ99DRAFT_392753 [Mytilinidion resinicola]|uniref:AB hydrolase-1 domain-containing protein n=1 Tax=Mytilinidion resinicola TaxID=574789 RepID=A0A6A6YFG1_9PEZI|nr:uncharacterized protein BDZ99DRAFT_392753 [Mytilinidion resinicola]KAF2807470.1 hypothetical protein BDZ99DRAFT_392753 [Mytilinidion resinicola]
MIGTSTAEYVFIWACVITLHLIAPICVTYCILTTCLPSNLRLSQCFEYWASAETLFYFLIYLYQRYHLQRPTLHPPPLSKEGRHKLFDLCQDTIQDHGRYISKWFLDVPPAAIRRENIKEWFRWAFLNTAMDDPNYDDEVEGYVKKLERRTGIYFEPGRANVKCLRLTLDKVDALHRSLIWYMCIFMVDIITHAIMFFCHFQFHRSSLVHCVSIFPPRPQTFIASRRSPAKDLTYWYRPHTSRKESPILFLHGIGVGLYPYVRFLNELNQGRGDEDGKIGILAVEILPVSSRITPAILGKEGMCQRLRAILRHHGVEKFVLVSHSYGSVIAAYLLKTPGLASQIVSVILVDPVSILLHQPDVAYNFTFRKPKFANEWLIWYFGSKDMGVAYTLSRQFFWFESILWKEDLMERHTTVFLSGKDLIVNTPQVRTYLQGVGEQQNGRNASRGEANRAEKIKSLDRMDGRLNVVWCADLDHGEIFDSAVWRTRLESEVLKQAARASSPLTQN